MSCSTKQNIDIQGHRGCRGLLPENSLQAFEKAIDLGVNTLELDISITKDKQVIVSHEPFMNSIICKKPDGTEISKEAQETFNLYKMTHDEIKQFDCGTKFHQRFPNQTKVSVHKPLLTELFELVKEKKSDVNFNIEIKSEPKYYNVFTPRPAEYVELVLDEIIEAKLFTRANLQSFDLEILEEIKKKAPKMRVALLIDEDENIKTKLSKLSYKPEIISPYFKLLSKNIVKDLKSRNFKVIPWTVNSKTDLKQMIDFQVDGIITDYPDVLINIF